ncbi:uncharacterized protein LOC126982825 [Eriocheir sinensis]|uniref:uncharacterized protein LOC126982825 n=1 Tax=Eriocheir sinensis TaxID=95602 RepID=UPI0021C5BC9E|nr:uncharacterized protein LOC126982825 [Eriocheir sinensis]
MLQLRVAAVLISEPLVVDAAVESRWNRVAVNELLVAELSRDYHNSQLACVANNNNVTSPSTTAFTLVMSLRPLVTRLEHPPRSLRVGRQYHILCVTAGSRPHPNITWTLGNVASISPLLAETQHEVNVSSSRVALVASRRHHGQRLSCTALNPRFPDHPLTDSLLLNVTCECVGGVG